MAVTITVTDVRNEYPDTTASDSAIEAFIATVDAADACLATKPDSVQRAIKMAGIGYLLDLSAGQSTVQSERSANGSSVTYKDGTASASYALLQTLDTDRCVLNLLASSGPDLFIGVSNGSY